MASRFASDYGLKLLHMAAMGNAWAEDYKYTGSAAQNDKVYLGLIPAGVRVYPPTVLHTAGGASTTLTLGFEPTDGTPAADTNYWLDAADVATAGAATSTAEPITFDRPVKLVATIGGGAFASGSISVIVPGKVVGAA